jgi:hypothetical protein
VGDAAHASGPLSQEDERCGCRRKAADAFAAHVRPIIREIQKSGVSSFRGVAKALSARGIKTARGGEWSAVQVSDILRRGKVNRARRGQRAKDKQRKASAAFWKRFKAEQEALQRAFKKPPWRHVASDVRLRESGQSGALLDHLVGAIEQGWRHFEVERLRGLEIDD